MVVDIVDGDGLPITLWARVRVWDGATIMGTVIESGSDIAVRWDGHDGIERFVPARDGTVESLMVVPEVGP